LRFSQEGRKQVKRRAKVLIADDRATARDALKALLALFPQVEVVGEAENGGASLDLVAEYMPDVVLMDMQMPEMDGLEATRRIKDQWPEVQVAVLTIYPHYRTEALAAGADTFLLKGDSPTHLRDAILSQLQGLSGRTE
jgi:DNA-binding NarL/FixJ family response regulator